MTRSNSQLFILVFLGILTAFGPFVTDMYLPTLPAMTDYFHTTKWPDTKDQNRIHEKVDHQSACSGKESRPAVADGCEQSGKCLV